MVKKFHVTLILVYLVFPLILFQLKNNESLHAGFDIVVKKLEGFKNVMCDFDKVLYPFLMLMCGTTLITAHLCLVVNHTYERMLLGFVGSVKRNGLDKVMTRRVFMSMTGLMALVVVEIQSIIILAFLSSLFVTLVDLVMFTYKKDTSGFTEGVCLCFFASAVVYAFQKVVYHALACFCVSGFALAAKLLEA